MPLSGADITSEKTSAASFSRLAGSLLAASSGARAKVVNKIRLMFTSLSSHPVHVPCHTIIQLYPPVALRSLERLYICSGPTVEQQTLPEGPRPGDSYHDGPVY